MIVLSSDMQNQIPTDTYDTQIELYTHPNKKIDNDFVLFLYTCRLCDVYPYIYIFLQSSQMCIDNHQVKCVQSYPLISNKCFWIMDLMPNSLVNLNKIKASVKIFQDNPFSVSPLYIEDPGGLVVVPMQVNGNNKGLESITGLPK